jgi:uncharacterized protein YdiU (UPF0061 family)
LAQESLGAFQTQYSASWLAGMKTKQGLPGTLDYEATTSLTGELFPLMLEARVDYTSFFRGLGAAERSDATLVRSMFPGPDSFDACAEHWRALDPDADLMDRTNPVYIPRNHLIDESLAAVDGNQKPRSQLLAIVTEPCQDRPGLERYAAAAPESFGPYRTFCGT